MRGSELIRTALEYVAVALLAAALIVGWPFFAMRFSALYGWLKDHLPYWLVLLHE